MPERQPFSNRAILALIMGGLLVWGIYVAVGSYLYNFDVRRAVVVLASVGMFLGFWLLLLWNQARKKGR